jgi:predicted glycosyltransferase
MARAMGVVCMGGYNTFCEVLSFDKPALVIPRTAPRKEQLIRATRTEELGLIRMLAGDGRRAPQTMAEALRALPHQAPPSSVVVPGLLDGRANVIKLARQLLEQGGTPFAEAERSLFAVGQGAE